ncbi:MAG: hypothetical protein FJ098_04615 [Deltaproteobacteria bacterium]|nr:hypothetical protein [Deltaproteobacteria bacterium]
MSVRKPPVRWRKTTLRFSQEDRKNLDLIAQEAAVRLTGGKNDLIRRVLAKYARLLVDARGGRIYLEREGEGREGRTGLELTVF